MCLVNKGVCLEIYKRGVRPVIMRPKYQGRLDGFHGWRDEDFRKIVTEHGFKADDMVIVSCGVLCPGSLACQDLWEVRDAEKEGKTICLTTTEPKIYEFGGVF